MTVINIPPSADTYIESRVPNANHGSSTIIRTGKASEYGVWNVYEILMNFDIMSYIPVNAVITNAKLYLYMTYPASNSGENLRIRDIPIANRTWTETGVTWNNRPTYNNTYPETYIPITNQNTWNITDITSYVQDQYIQGLGVNFDLGCYDTCLGGNGMAVDFNSNNASSNKPYLQVTYTTDITATAITVTPTSCISPCSININVTWKNNGTVSYTFRPGITIDGTLYQKSSMSLAAGATTTQTFTVSGLLANVYMVCPVPN